MRGLIWLIIVLLSIALAGCGKVITDNGISIPQSQIDQIATAQNTLQKIKVNRQDIINQIVDQTLLQQEAKKEGIIIPEKDLDQKYKEILALWDQGGEIQNSLKAQGYTQSGMKEQVRTQMLIDALLSRSTKSTDPEQQIAKAQELLKHLKGVK